MPEDLTALKALLKDEQKLLKEKQKHIAEIESAIIKQEPSFYEKTPALVSIDTVQLSSFVHYEDVQATVAAEDLVMASSEMGGSIKVFVKEGQLVSRGALIAKVDAESIQKQINEVETSLSLATDIYNRQKRLWNQKIGSEVQYLQAKNNKERLEKSLESVKVGLKKSSIYAPISGVVDKQQVESGEVVAPGMPIVSILDERKVKVVADLSESMLGKVKRGQKLSVLFPSINKTQEVIISRVGSTIHPTNRTFTVEANLKNNDKLLKANLLAVVKLKDFEVKDAVLVPSNLVQTDLTGRPFVYTVDPKTKLAKQQVIEIGQSYEGLTWVKSGLKAKDLIVKDGAKSIEDGALISWK